MCADVGTASPSAADGQRATDDEFVAVDLPSPGPPAGPTRQRTAAATAALVRHLVLRDLRIRYSRSALGWLWSLAQPVSRLVILGFVFTRAIPLDIEDYPAFLFIGLVAYQWFATGVLATTTSLVDNRALLLRPGFPRATVPVVAVLTSVLDTLAALAVLIVFVAATVGLSAAIVVLPGLLVLQLLLMTGLGMLLCVANVYARDVRLLVDLLVQLGFYLTPVFYDPEIVPGRFRGVLEINPMAHQLEALRTVLLDGTLPAADTVIRLSVVCVTVFVAGLIVFQRTAHSVVDEL